ncbi:heme A synthase [Aquitalea magnusonii]|uniref:Heme A synthase n=2 Tax=Aquitalea magnusonii TaxID=332411 RepID=A0A3G9GN00_9NEIS|nr:heme A synthase [Aquitalea magnusonii]
MDMAGGAGVRPGCQEAEMRKLLWLAVLLALVLLPLGAYVRLSQAGLGCPDWPGCYGQLSPAHAAAAIERAMQLQPDGPVSPDKAWKEMAHRYLAAALGVLLFCLWWQAWRQAQRLAMASLLLLVLLLQAMLGMLTVTLQLRPWVVTSHLLLGMSLFALLLAAARRAQPRVAVLPAHGRLVTLLLLLVLGQIALGGWMAANHAALACQGFPRCNGQWWPDMQFTVTPPAWPWAVGTSVALPAAALVALHWLHRLGALLLLCVLCCVVGGLWRYPVLRRSLCLLVLLAGLQLLLGMLNVLWLRPLPLALAHHVFAMLLLAQALGIRCRVQPSACWHGLRAVRRRAFLAGRMLPRAWPGRRSGAQGE